MRALPLFSPTPALVGHILGMFSVDEHGCPRFQRQGGIPVLEQNQRLSNGLPRQRPVGVGSKERLVLI